MAENEPGGMKIESVCRIAIQTVATNGRSQAVGMGGMEPDLMGTPG